MGIRIRHLYIMFTVQVPVFISGLKLKSVVLDGAPLLPGRD